MEKSSESNVCVSVRVCVCVCVCVTQSLCYTLEINVTL